MFWESASYRPAPAGGVGVKLSRNKYRDAFEGSDIVRADCAFDDAL
jgi:hypothetical protein